MSFRKAKASNYASIPTEDTAVTTSLTANSTWIPITEGTITAGTTTMWDPLYVSPWATSSTITTTGTVPYIYPNNFTITSPAVNITLEIESLKSTNQELTDRLDKLIKKIEQLESMIPELFESIEFAHEKLK